MNKREEERRFNRNHFSLGLATEFMTKEQAKGTYGPKGPSSYKDIVPDFHRSR